MISSGQRVADRSVQMDSMSLVSAAWFVLCLKRQAGQTLEMNQVSIIKMCFISWQVSVFRLIVSLFVIMCLPSSATSHFPSQNATGTENYTSEEISMCCAVFIIAESCVCVMCSSEFYSLLSETLLFSVYLGSEFVREALQRAKELTDTAYAHTTDRWNTQRSLLLTSWSFL